jgi:hypothetical protein
MADIDGEARSVPIIVADIESPWIAAGNAIRASNNTIRDGRQIVGREKGGETDDWTHTGSDKVVPIYALSRNRICSRCR